MSLAICRLVAVGCVLFTGGCATEEWTPPSDVTSVHLTMRDAPESTALYRYEGPTRARYGGPLLGPIVCASVPCDTTVTAGQYVMATSPEFVRSNPVRVPRASEVRAVVDPGYPYARTLAFTGIGLGTGALVTGILLAATETGTIEPGADFATFRHPYTASGTAFITGGTLLAIAGMYFAFSGNTRLQLITSDGVVHF